MRYHLTPDRIALIKKTASHKCWQSMWRKGDPHALLVGLSIGAATIGNIMEFLQKIKNKTIMSSNSTSGHLPKENKD